MESNNMPQYETGAERAAREAAELAALEGQGQEQQQDPAQDTPAQTPAQSPAQPIDWEKRYKDLQSHHDKTLTELRSQLPAQDFETENEKLQRQVAELHQDLAQRNTADKVREAQQQVGAAHPDFVGIIQSEQFATWIESQPDIFKDSIYSEVPDANIAVKVLTLFKAEHQAPQQPQQPAPQDASMAIGRGQQGTPSEVNGPKIWSMSEIQRMNPTEYAANAQEIDLAFAEGRVRS